MELVIHKSATVAAELLISDSEIKANGRIILISIMGLSQFNDITKPFFILSKKTDAQ